MPIVNKQYFRKHVASKIDESLRQRAFDVFCNYGKNLRTLVIRMLYDAIDLGKVEETLSLLEAHYEEYLQSVEEKNRVGISEDEAESNPTVIFIRTVYETTLNRQLAAT